MSDVPFTTPAAESGSFMTVTSANHFDKQADFTDHVVSSLHRNREYHEFIFNDVPPSWADAVYQHIDEIIPSRKSYNSESRELRIRVKPTEILDCIQPWLFKQPLNWLLNGDITLQEVELFDPGVGTTLFFKSGPYSGSWKEPDFFFRPNNLILPTTAVESGWSESKELLRNGMDLSLVGGNGSINVVIIVQWTRLQERVSGTVELFVRDKNGMPTLQQSEPIFPRPAAPNNLSIKRRDLFGPALVPGRNGNDTLYLDLERLRNYATRGLGFMNLVPS
ncbi:hypothetical protein IFM58399_09563 [Aspergillus lentulus]|uniref:Uncharacterized protein n=1 Tax=Aspergillus lentulus TaxID=293939 RepID=A0ABQ1A6L9_ASPLE|nr:uncharacterized protein IFM58399_09563 [Aspergillus lentulus]GFF53403.1 hypothetical protein IFM58399_09563 [Aspergillus lentulus]GFF74846.1 hypothetical protein IFM60648_04295 [Aspergillus lentulus]GFG04873.1 hypothetical protein IFM61392_03543 [Aspergillus lentulus]